MAIEKFYMRGSKPIIRKDPNDVLDYTIDFEDWLGSDGDVIIGAVVAGTTLGITVVDFTFTNTRCTGWLSGGVVVEPGDPLPSATYRITTAAGRVVDRTLYFKVQEH